MADNAKEWHLLGYPVYWDAQDVSPIGDLLTSDDALRSQLDRIERNTARVNPTPEERAAAKACMPDAMSAVKFEQHGRIVGVRRS